MEPTSSSAPVPAYNLIQCSSLSLPHPVLQFQSTSSSAPVPVYLIYYSRAEDFSLISYKFIAVFINLKNFSILISLFFKI